MLFRPRDLSERALVTSALVVFGSSSVNSTLQNVWTGKRKLLLRPAMPPRFTLRRNFADIIVRVNRTISNAKNGGRGGCVK